MLKIMSTLLMFLLAATIAVYGQATPAGILFVGVQNKTSDIYLWQPGAEDGVITPLTRTPVKEGNASWWSRKGLILASREQADGSYGLVAINEKLETVWELTDPEGSLGWAAGSPWDDRILCVRSLSNGFVQTGVVNFPDGKFEPFEYEGLSGGQLAWLSPDKIMLSRVVSDGFMLTHRELSTGNEEVVVSGGLNWQSYVNEGTGRMFFVRRVGQISSIFELCKDAAGKYEYTNLTNSRSYDWEPATSPDCQTLIYQSMRDGKFVTIIRDLATGNEKQISLPGFSQIYFPTILDSETCQKLLAWN